MEPVFNDDKLMLRLNVVHKLRKLLQRDGEGYKSALYRRVGVGLTEEEFEFCVKMLEISGWCVLTKGKQDAVILKFNEQFNNVNVPEIPEAAAQ